MGLSTLFLEGPRDTTGSFTGSANAAGDTKASGETKKTVITNQTPLSDAELKILRSLEKRRGELDERERELHRREERIKLAEKQLDTKYGELKSIRDEISRLFEEEKKQRDDRLKTMVNTIALGMKPEEAAAVMARMDTALVLRMMSLVPEKKLGKIMEKMDKDKAASLTAEFINYHMKMPKPPQ